MLLFLKHHKKIKKKKTLNKVITKIFFKSLNMTHKTSKENNDEHHTNRTQQHAITTKKPKKEHERNPLKISKSRICLVMITNFLFFKTPELKKLLGKTNLHFY